MITRKSCTPAQIKGTSFSEKINVTYQPGIFPKSYVAFCIQQFNVINLNYLGKQREHALLLV